MHHEVGHQGNEWYFNDGLPAQAGKVVAEDGKHSNGGVCASQVAGVMRVQRGRRTVTAVGRADKGAATEAKDVSERNRSDILIFS